MIATLAVACRILPEPIPWCKDGMVLAPGDSCRKLDDEGEARFRVRSDGQLCVQYRPDDPAAQADVNELCIDEKDDIAFLSSHEATRDSTWTLRF